MTFQQDYSEAIARGAFVFPRSEEWEIQIDGEQVGISSVPGTWWKPEGSNLPIAKEVLAIVSCPNCKMGSVISDKFMKVDNLGKLTPDFKCQGCEFARPCYLDRWNNKPLYACAIERIGKGGKIKPEIVYCHANNQVEARIHIGPGNYRIVAIGRAIGFFVNDKEGKSLSAD